MLVEKVLHIDEHMNTRIIEAIAEIYSELTILVGKKHKFMGIDI